MRPCTGSAGQGGSATTLQPRVPPTVRWPPAGRSSASSSPTTSPPTARRSATGPTRSRSATSAPRGPTWRASTAPARSARRTCTSATTRPSSCSGQGGHDVPRNHEGIALVGDPRNDTHLFMNQMQVALHHAPQPARRPAARGRRRTRPTSSTRRGRATDLALPVGDPARVPAAAGRRRLAAELLDGGARALPARRRAVHPLRVRRRRRTATATARSGTATASTATSGRCPSSPT